MATVQTNPMENEKKSISAKSDLTADAVRFFDADCANAGVDTAAVVSRVCRSNAFVLAQEVSHFEREFAQFLGAKHCVGVANGTDALELAMRALHIKANDRVAMVANAAFYGSTAAHAIGAKPIYVDVNADTYNMCPQQLQRTIVEEGNIACIIVTHLYGNMAPMADIMAIADAHDISVVEDCAQAHGAQANGRFSGTFGALASFSFYPTKNLGGLGDGGAVVCKADVHAQRLRALRQYGWGEKYEIAHQGGRNSRLDEMQAAILRDKLPLLLQANASRRSVAMRYNKAFAHLPIGLPPLEDLASVCHLFVIRCQNRADAQKQLTNFGIFSAIHYPRADHLQPAYICAQKAGSLPVTESLSKQVLSLPCYPGMPAAHVDRVIAAVLAVFSP